MSSLTIITFSSQKSLLKFKFWVMKCLDPYSYTSRITISSLAFSRIFMLRARTCVIDSAATCKLEDEDVRNFCDFSVIGIDFSSQVS